MSWRICESDSSSALVIPKRSAMRLGVLKYEAHLESLTQLDETPSVEYRSGHGKKKS
jgi:hypothetical protein